MFYKFFIVTGALQDLLAFRIFIQVYDRINKLFHSILFKSQSRIHNFLWTKSQNSQFIAFKGKICNKLKFSQVLNKIYPLSSFQVY